MFRQIERGNEKEGRAPVSSMDVSQNEQILIAGHENGYLSFYDLNAMKLMTIERGQLSSKIMNLKIASNGKKIVKKCSFWVGSQDGLQAEGKMEKVREGKKEVRKERGYLATR